jgi:purine-binding chemotaxis protein CheW
MTVAPWSLAGAASGARMYLALRALDSNFALPVAFARSVFRIEALTRVPLAPPYVLGLANLRGEIVAAICLTRRLDPDAPIAGIGSLAVVLELGAETFALAVQEIGDVIHASDDDVAPMPIHVDVRRAAPMSGVLRSGPALIPILDPPSLFDFRRFGEAA